MWADMFNDVPTQMSRVVHDDCRVERGGGEEHVIDDVACGVLCEHDTGREFGGGDFGFRRNPPVVFV